MDNEILTNIETVNSHNNDSHNNIGKIDPQNIKMYVKTIINALENKKAENRKAGTSTGVGGQR